MGLKRKSVEPENHDRWLVSYADFITLMFAFFVVLYATSTQNKDKERSFENSLRDKFAFLSVGGPGGGMTGGVYTLPGAGGPFGAPIEGIDNFPKRGGPTEVMEFVDRQLTKKFTKEDLKSYVGQVAIDPIGVRISLKAEGFFAPGSYKMKAEALKSLNKVAEILRQSDHKIQIEGHTDASPLVPKVGSAMETNWELGALRATTIVRYLIKVQGIGGSRLGAVSYADQRPVGNTENTDDPTSASKTSSGSPEAQKAASNNRRIDIVLLNHSDDIN